MGKRTYTKVSPNLWTSQRFRGVEHQARLFYVYLLTNEHVDSCGCYRLPLLYAAADFGVDAETAAALVRALETVDLIAYDADAEFVLVKRWFKHNPPMNKDHAAGTRRLISEIQSEALLEQCEADFADAETLLQEQLDLKAAAKAEWEARAKEKYGVHKDAPGLGFPASAGLTSTRFLSGGAR
jgi:hypothetical protein